MKIVCGMDPVKLDCGKFLKSKLCLNNFGNGSVKSEYSSVLLSRRRACYKLRQFYKCWIRIWRKRFLGSKTGTNVVKPPKWESVSKPSIQSHHPEYQLPVTIHQKYGRDFKQLVGDYKLYHDKLSFYSRLCEVIDHQQVLRKTPQYYLDSYPMRGQRYEHYPYAPMDYHYNSPYFFEDHGRDRPRFESVDRYDRLRQAHGKLHPVYQLHGYEDRNYDY